MRRVQVELRRMRLGQFQNVSREFNRRDLHAEAQAEVGDLVFARVLGGQNFPLHAAFAKAARHQDAAEPFQNFFRAVLFNLLGVQLHDLHAAIIRNAAVDDRLVDGFIGVLQAYVFADDADAHAMLWRDELADDLLPVRHVRRRRVQVEQAADEVVEALAVQHQRQFINGMIHVLGLDDAFERDVAEHGNLLAQFLVERLLATARDDVRRDADFAQLGDALLRGLGLQFARRLDERNVGDVEKNRVVITNFQRELADRFEKGQTLDVAGGAADLGDDDIGL